MRPETSIANGGSHMNDGRTLPDRRGLAIRKCMPMTNSSPGDVRASATAKLSALSACGWGLIAYFIGHTAFGHSIWGGIVAAPLIGVLIGHLSKSIEAKPRPVQVVASLLDLYLAAICFAAATAVF